MVTLARLDDGNHQQQANNTSKISNKTPNLHLERQQLFRSSKRFKRQTVEIIDISPKQPQEISDSTMLAALPSLEMLACYEDSSFIYCQTNTNSNNSNQSIPTKCSSRASSFASSSTTDSMLSSSRDGSFTCCASSTNSKMIARTTTNKRPTSDYSSASPFCISALDFWHLTSGGSTSTNNLHNSFQTTSSQTNLKHLQQHFNQEYQQQQQKHQQLDFNLQPQQQQSFATSNGLNTAQVDPVYLEDEEVFYNLILKESAEFKWRQTFQQQHGFSCLVGQQRHSLLSWMLEICEAQKCQDEIFPLATMILDKFLLFQVSSQSGGCAVASSVVSKRRVEGQDGAGDKRAERVEQMPEVEGEKGQVEEQEEEEFELRFRQLYLFAACSLLLATKLRQTPRLCIQKLCNSSERILPVRLSRAEILDGELLILVALKWDLAALVTPNDFLGLLWSKCKHLLPVKQQQQRQQKQLEEEENKRAPTAKTTTTTTASSTLTSKTMMVMNGVCGGKTSDDLRKHTQIMLDLCLMDTQLSQFLPSILAMASMAVAINGLKLTKNSLDEIVAQIHEATHKVNELKQMIDVAFQIEKYVKNMYEEYEELKDTINSTRDD